MIPASPSSARGGGEFDLIARHLAPLAGEGALGLRDDVGLIAGDGVAAPGLAVTKDLLVPGTHFLADDPLDTVARKAVRVNASDLIAKGCAPRALLLGLVWPHAPDDAAYQALAAGLRADLDAFGLTLLGGDTTRGDVGASLFREPAPLLSVTMLGVPLGKAIVPRGGASPGDRLLVAGAIGDAGLGLRTLTGRYRPAPAHRDALVAAYRTPEPPLAAAPLIAAHASAALDVSDGLLADAGHLARASGVRAVIRAEAVPLSEAARAYVAGGGGVARLATAGDDYQPLVAVPAARADAFADAARAAGVPFAAVGVCEAGEGVRFLGPGGTDLTPGTLGFEHFREASPRPARPANRPPGRSRSSSG